MCNKIFLLLSIFVFILILLPNCVFSAPCYGPSMPVRNTWWGGLQFNSIQEHDLADNKGKMKSNQCFFNLSYGVMDWLSLDGKLGVGDVRHDSESQGDMNYDYNFAGGYGFRIRICKEEEHIVTGIFGFQHISVHPDHVFKNGVENNVIYDDWQFSFLLSKRLDKLRPYIGAKVSRSDLIHEENGENHHRYKPENYLGLVAGLDFTISEKIILNVEGRFFDEDAFSCGGTLIF